MKSETPDSSSSLFELPAFDVPQIEREPSGVTWERAIRAFESQRLDYMRDFDSPEKRLRDKNPVPFRMD